MVTESAITAQDHAWWAQALIKMYLFDDSVDLTRSSLLETLISFVNAENDDGKEQKLLDSVSVFDQKELFQYFSRSTQTGSD